MVTGSITYRPEARLKISEECVMECKTAYIKVARRESTQVYNKSPAPRPVKL